ncbi:ricin-type beta-trefoil lectin domain protein [Dactylosporangium sp. NPDC050588]|uniref:ricin-type beta-trefoil lectin domain protein n=1 Tax=Dactylosporangium sp. NPDC050588 TaxID=3157211 RepID=UPI0033C549E3
MDSGSPWSGAYRVGRSLWANAHYGQLTAPGWKYLNSAASGYLGGNRANGSYVSLKSPNNSDYSTVYETSGTTSTQTVNVTVSGGLSTGTVRVWSTDMGSSNPASWFVRQADINPVNGSYSLTMQPNRIYTLTTTSGQGKGTAASPATAPLGLPYSDDFDGYGTRKSPRYFEDMQGSFETRACAAGRAGTCLQQVAPTRPINWQDDSDAFTLAGVLKGQESGLCVDVPGAGTTNGTAVNLWNCNGGTNQSWSLTPSRQLQVYGTKCVDVNGGGTANGTLVQLWECNGSAAQVWSAR